MLAKLFCWLLGHKIVSKAFTGRTFDTVDRLTMLPMKGFYYKWEREPFCLRCGAEQPWTKAERGEG